MSYTQCRPKVIHFIEVNSDFTGDIRLMVNTALYMTSLRQLLGEGFK